ncbi:MAG: hypothetical protein JOZ71_01520 [Ktedonobacteraceae bacterium]|nr:hypothetical protein [Ktedonobacteraceae bacterium]
MVEKEESAKKPTLYDLRVKHGGNLRELAQQSGVDGTRVHAMLLNAGVTLPDAHAVLAAFNSINQTSYRLNELDVRFIGNKSQKPLSPATDTRPTFQQVCEKAGVSWMDVSRGAAVPDEVGYQMYKGAAVFVEDCDDMLAVLSALTGQNWTRAEVGGILLRTDIWNNPRLPDNERMQ